MVANACNPSTQEPNAGGSQGQEQNGLYQILDKLGDSVLGREKTILVPMYRPIVSKCNLYPGALKFQRVFFFNLT